MDIDRRQLTLGLGGLMAMPLGGCAPTETKLKTNTSGENSMYGLIAKMTAVDGKRDELSAILLEGLRDMPGNLSYIVANDPADADVLWITEAWVDQAAHTNSLTLPGVQAAISKGRPLIAGMERIAETNPVGGTGL